MNGTQVVDNDEEKERMAQWCELWRPGRDDRRPTRSSDFDRICGWSLCGSSPAPTAWPCRFFGIVPRLIRRWEKRPRSRIWREMHRQRWAGLWTRREGAREEIAGSGPRRRGRGNTAS
ncbi:hypothetical protein GGI43DRAFT_92365 [Trichoderma evansii]